MISGNRFIKKSNHGLFIILFLYYCANFALAGSKRVNNLLDLATEEFKVTTTPRHSKKRTEVAFAVFVVTQDDIKRSGATNIPETLRIAPKVEVARIVADMGGIITVINAGKDLNIAVDLKCIQHAAFKLNMQLP